MIMLSASVVHHRGRSASMPHSPTRWSSTATSRQAGPEPGAPLSYLDSTRHHGRRPLDAICDALSGTPWTPPTVAAHAT